MSYTSPYPKSNKGIGLSIFTSNNASTSAIFGNQSLFMKTDIQSSDLPLYIKSKPSGLQLARQTNWDFSLNSFKFNSSMANDGIFNSSIGYLWKDYSRNKNDSFYDVDGGIDYYITSDWSISDMDSIDDIVVAGISDWTSTEKLVPDTPITRSFYAETVIIDEIEFFPVTYSTSTYYSFDIYWQVGNSSSRCKVTYPGNLVVVYPGDAQYQIAVLPKSQPVGGYSGVMTVKTSLDPRIYTPIVEFLGDPNTWDCYTIDYDNVVVGTETKADPLPDGAVLSPFSMNYYYFSTPNPDTYKTSNIIIHNAHFLFDQNPKSYLDLPDVDPSASITEYYDYSDIFIDVSYINVLDNTTTDRTYKFAGYVSYEDFVNGNSTLLNNDPAHDTILYWKILIYPNNQQFGVILSSYAPFIPDGVSPQEIGKYFNAAIPDGHVYKPYETPLPFLENLIIAHKNVLCNIKTYKIVNYPECGKVDLYIKKTGYFSSINSGTGLITSINHGLSTGDKIKITNALSNSSQTNLNGAYFVKVANQDSFYLCVSSSDLNTYIVPQNYKSSAISGIRWSLVSGAGYNYNTTIYSPCGKNGYSAKAMGLFSSYENPTNDDGDLNNRSVIYNTFLDDYNQSILNFSPVKAPQGFFNGARSWNNFYPFQRFNDTANTALGIVNGNKFGTSVKIKKYSDNQYIVMVTEPGAFESFQIIDFFDLPATNVKVIPSYFPYGRIHFYKITKNTSTNSYTVDYIDSVSRSDNPWIDYEQSNQSQKAVNTDSNYKNYPLAQSTIINNYNKYINNYWWGARYVSWSKDWIYDSLYSANMPNVASNPNEYGFVDFFGKSADFEIENNSIYCLTSCNVKNANFSTTDRVNYIDALTQSFTYDLNSFSAGSISTIVSQKPEFNSDYQQQLEEYSSFGETVKFNDHKVYWGWASEFANNEYLYYYTRDSDTYTLQQTITSPGNYGFGSYIVAKDDTLLTNKYEYYDDSGQLMTDPIDYIQVYKLYSNTNTYGQRSRVSATIDLSNSKYTNLIEDQYQIANNISYDGTSTNTASYILSLKNKYDIYKDLLFIRDYNEIACFRYDPSTKTFKNKFHEFVYSNSTQLNSDKAILRAVNSFAAASFDSIGDFDTGEFSSSIQILDASQDTVLSVTQNYLSSIDLQDPEYLPLFVKNIEGITSNSLPLRLANNIVSSGNLDLYLEPIRGKTSSQDLYLRPPLDASGNLSLNIFNPKASTANAIPLILHQQQSNGSLPLFITYDNTVRGIMPLVIGIDPTIDTYSELIELYIESHYTGVPNSSGVCLLYLEADQYADYAASIGFNLNSTVKEIDTSGTNTNLSLMIHNGTGYLNSNQDLYMRSEMGYFTDAIMPLYIKRPIAEAMPLFVYNNNASGGIPLYVKNAPTWTGSLPLVMGSGFYLPSKSITLFTRGTTFK